MERNIGVEIEVVDCERSIVVQALRDAGIRAQDEGYNHYTRSHWKVVADGSVKNSERYAQRSGNSYGFEIVSPILCGETGLAELKKVCAALVSCGAKINKTCGLHIHFDAAWLNSHDVKQIVSRYAKFETQIDCFFPPSRRNNQYCKSIVRFAEMASFWECRTISDLAYLQNDRYTKVNLTAFNRHGTIEFRQHSGSVEFQKIESWIRFLDAFITQSCLTSGAVAPVSGNLPAELSRLINSLTSNRYGIDLQAEADREGVEIAIIYRRMTKLHKLGFKTRKKGGLHGLVNFSASNDSLFAGIPETLVQYFQARTALFA